MAARVATWGVSISALGAAVQLLWRRWRRFRSRRKFDGLDGVVSFSSRLIAAARAIESMRPDALFVDPFAKLLAGPKAMARHQKFDEADKSVNIATGKVTSPAAQPAAPTAPDGNPQQTAAQTGSSGDIHQEQQHQPQPQQQQLQQSPECPTHPGRQVSRLVLRTVFFDEATLLVTGQSAPRSDHALAPVAAHIQQHGLKSCRQVVMLGAGMDTRPWRLPLDPHLKWFELDRQDVLAAKQAALRQAGASFEPGGQSSPAAQQSAGSTNSSSTNSSSSKGGSSSAGGVQQYPLRVGQWACASADLQQRGWVAKLQEAGLDPQQPTVWAAEGLLYYLEPDSVAPMLKEAASMSPAGSMLITNFMTDEGLKLLLVSPLTAQPGQGTPSAAGTAGTTGSAAAPADSSSHQPVLDGDSRAETATVQAAPTGAEGDGAQQGSAVKAAVGAGGSEGQGGNGAAPGVKRPPASDLQKNGLLTHFKWGCPDKVEEFFAECGWKLLVRYSLTEGAEAYGWTIQHTAASRVRTNSQEVQFVVGVVIK